MLMRRVLERPEKSLELPKIPSMMSWSKGWTRSKQETLWLIVTRWFQRIRNWALASVI